MRAVARLEALRKGDVVSLDARDDADDDPIEDLFANDGGAQAAAIIAGAQHVRLTEDLRAALVRLEPRLRFVLRARYAGDLTLDQVGARLGLSRERVRQLEAEALATLRLTLRRRELARERGVRTTGERARR